MNLAKPILTDEIYFCTDVMQDFVLPRKNDVRNIPICTISILCECSVGLNSVASYLEVYQLSCLPFLMYILHFHFRSTCWI